MQFQRSIGLIGLTFVAISGTLGSGWLFAPLLTAQLAGPAAMVSWCIGGAAMLLLALCFAEVTGVLPLAGGIARLPYLTHGNLTSAVLGWTAWVGYNTAAPIETIVMLEYLDPWVGGLFTGDSSAGNLTPLGCLVAAAALALFVAINWWGAAALTQINSFITWIKLLAPIAVGAAILSLRFEPANFTHNGFAPTGVEGVLAAVSSGGVIFALIGFRHAIDLAGEVKRPQVTIPLALTLAVAVCVAVYLLLQTAFIGGLSAAELEHGWGKLSFDKKFGPLAAIAAGLGIAWVAAMLHTGALLGPFGGGLIATGSMARLGYALSQNGFFPDALNNLSKRGVPEQALLLNYLFGLLVVLFVPFHEAVAICAAAITLSFAGGPLAVYALRKQLPEAARPFRLPAASLFAGVTFVVVTMIIYWSGWNTAWRLGLLVAIGLVVFAVKMHRDRVPRAKLDLIQAAWLPPYLLGLGLLAYFGNYGGGSRAIPFPWDLAAAAALAVAVYCLANHCRLSNATASRYREQFDEPQPEPPTAPVPRPPEPEPTERIEPAEEVLVGASTSKWL